MDFKFPFVFLIISVTVLGIIPFGLSQQQTEPSMEIDMLSGQTQYPFRIQDNTDTNVFAVKPNGGFDPLPVELVEITLTDSLYDEWHPTWKAESPNLTCPNAESGTGVYQFSHIVTAQDVDGSVDSAGMFTKDKFIPVIQYQVQNTDIASIGMDVKLFINDVEVVLNLADGAVSAGNYVYGHTGDRELYTGAVASNPYIKAGDEIGFKCFQTSGTADSLQLNHVWLQGYPKLTVDALNISFSWVDWGLHPESTHAMEPTAPNFAGVTFLDWGDCITVVDTDWDQCWGNNSFAGDYEVSMGAELTYGWNGESDTENAGNNMWFPNDSILREENTVNVVRWK